MSRFSFDEAPGSRFGPVLETLIEAAERVPIDAGTPRPLPTALSEFDTATAFAHALEHNGTLDGPLADCCVAGVWLLYNELDRSHTLCQDVPTPNGSYWHGVVHRREGDYGNARYWFARGASLAVIDEIAGAIAADPVASGPFGGAWTPDSMVSVCQRAVRGDNRLLEACQAAQQIEWELLFAACYDAAIG